ncbi:MAG: transglycosylase SLT domain-containing protein [Chloroflexota bacterium]
MDRKNQQKLMYGFLVFGIVCAWGVAIFALIVPIARRLETSPREVVVNLASVQPDIGTPIPDQESLFPPTWTATTTPTPTSTGTPVETYPAWATWTPTATFTPSPTLPAREQNKRIAMRRYRSTFIRAAKKYNLDWRIMAEQGYYESGLNPHARGRSREMGLMQIIPSTWLLITREINVSDPFKPSHNIEAAAFYLSQMRDECRAIGQTDPGCMLLAYNWGPNNMRRHYLDRYTWRQAPDPQRRYVSYILREAGY